MALRSITSERLILLDGPQPETASLTVPPGSRIYQLSLNETQRTAWRDDVAIAPGDYLTLAIITGEQQ